VLRPSSPLSAKASTRCPYLALIRRTQRQTPAAPRLTPERLAFAARHSNPCAAPGPPPGILPKDRPAAPRPFHEDTPGRPSHRPAPRLAAQGGGRARGICRLGHVQLVSSPSQSAYPPPPLRGPPRMTFFLPSSSPATDPVRLPPPRVRPAQPPDGGGERDRTDDLLLAKQALSQLSYTPAPGIGHQGSVIRDRGSEPPRFRSSTADPRYRMVGQGGFEPPTSRLSSARSNQLSY
jgi:hypothetical protein